MPGPVHHVTRESIRVSQMLSNHFKCDSARVEELLSLGAVHEGRRRVFEDITVPKGSHLLVHLKPNRFDVQSVNWADTVVADEPDYLIAKKPGGIPVHGTPDNATENVLEQLRLHRNTNLFITQRLDTPVSGLVLFAKTRAFQEHFNRILREGKLGKTYFALTTAPPPTGEHVHFLKEDGGRKRKSAESDEGLECRLVVDKVTALKKDGETTWYESQIRPLSGRTHQIRVQLSELRAPIMGDSLYHYRGPRISWSPRREIGLFSGEMKFTLPRGRAVSYQAAPPWRPLFVIDTKLC